MGYVKRHLAMKYELHAVPCAWIPHTRTYFASSMGSEAFLEKHEVDQWSGLFFELWGTGGARFQAAYKFVSDSSMQVHGNETEDVEAGSRHVPAF